MTSSRYIVSYKRAYTASRLDLSYVLHEIKKKMSAEKDAFKKQAWAEIGIELNRVFLSLQ